MHASHSGDIALAGSRRLRATLAATPVLFAHTVVTVAKNSLFIAPTIDLCACGAGVCLDFPDEKVRIVLKHCVGGSVLSFLARKRDSEHDHMVRARRFVRTLSFAFTHCCRKLR